MDIISILKIVSIVLGIVVTTVIPFVIGFFSNLKKRKEAKIEAEKAKTEAERVANEAKQVEAENDMLQAVNGFVQYAENLYKDIDSILKTQGKSSGPNKKDSVMTKLQAYAIEKGYPFNVEKWSDVVDNVVELTRHVNSK